MLPMISLSDEDARFASEQLSRGCSTMEQLLNGLLDSKGRVAEEVHAIRKLGKSLRGGFSLFQLRNSAKEIQVIGRLLSGPRDAVSRLSTWGKLAWDEDAAASSAILGLLDQQTHSAARRPPPETIAWCLERVRAARQNLLDLPPGNLPDLLAKGAKKLGKQVTKRCKNLDHNGEEDFHDARKALKAYLGAIGFLREGSVRLDPGMTELAEILGDENDLATLSVWLEEHGFTENFVPTLWLKLGDSRHKLRKQAIRDAGKLVTAKAE
ncbi:MAG: CHAD domain-containing protein [Verrucomicrobiota bacterium]